MSSTRSARIIAWPVVFQVTVEIDPERIASNETVGIVGLRLAKMGGQLVGWIPDLTRRAAVARFAFSNPAARDSFIARATEIAGVSIATPR